MVEMNLSDDLLKQIGVTDLGSSHTSSFDEEGTLRINVESHDEDTRVVFLSKDDGTLKTVDSTKEEESLTKDVVETKALSSKKKRLFIALMCLLSVMIAMAVVIVFKMR